MGEITLESVFEAYYDCRRHKRRTANQAVSELDYEDNLVELWRDINERRYEIGKSICFAVTRPKLREVFAADFRDRVVHHIVMQRLEPLMEEVFIEDNYNCRVGKGVLYGVNRLHERIRSVSENYTKDCWIGKFDMKGFFMSIDKDILWEKLKVFIEERYNADDKDIVLYLTEKIVFNEPQNNCIVKGDKELLSQLPANKSLFTCGKNKGLPIGNLTSQIFANFYLHEFDVAMQERYTDYGRYVDDFWVLSICKENILEARQFAERYLKESLCVELNRNKVYVQPYWHGVKFIGTMLKLDRKYISNRTIDSIFEKAKHLSDLYNAMCVVNSYFGFMRHCNSYGIRRRLAKALPQWIWKSVYIQGRFLYVKQIKRKVICTSKTTNTTQTQVSTSRVV